MHPIKIAIISFGIATLFLSPLQAGVEDINKQTHTSQSTYTTTTTDTDQNNINNGGYQKNTQVIDRKYEFAKTNLSQNDFSSWLALFHQAKAADYFVQLQKENQIKRNGEVKVYTLELGDKEFHAGQIIGLEDLEPIFEQQYNAAQLIQQLRTAAVIDEAGFIASANALPVDFEKIDFSYLFDRIKKINFKTNNTDLNDSLLRDLYNYIVNENRVIVVKEKETTTYKSSQTGLFEQIGDFFVGNAIGSVLFPDKVKTTKQQEQWTANTSVLDYYAFKPGFNSYPFYGNKGLIILNGKAENSTLELTGARTDSLKNYSINATKKYFLPVSRSTTSAGGYGNIGIEFNQLYDTHSALGYTTLFIGPGTIVGNTMTDFTMGITYKNSRSNNGLGFMVGGKFAWYIINPIGLEAGVVNYVQPNWLTNTNTWQMLRYNVAASVQISLLTGKIGYQWYRSGDSELLSSSYFSAGFYF